MFSEFQDPAATLQAAVEKLDLLTQQTLVSEKEPEDHPLKKGIRLIRNFIAPLFLQKEEELREQREVQIHDEILHLIDVVKSHSPLIPKLKEGDPSQQHLAHYALDVIQRYNALVKKSDQAKLAAEPSSALWKYVSYFYHSKRLSSRIKWHPIEIGHPVEVPVKRTFQALGCALTSEPSKKMATTYKNAAQFMKDAFHAKAMVYLQRFLTQNNSYAKGGHSMREILDLVKATPIEVESHPNTTTLFMRQVLEMSPGSILILTGAFKRHSEAKLMHFPILEDFRLIFQCSQSGVPFPSQHAARSLTANSLVDAYLLRPDQAASFQEIDQKRKEMAYRLTSNSEVMTKAKHLLKLKKDVFDQSPEIFLNKHRELDLAIGQACHYTEPMEPILDAFYAKVKEEPSAFEMLSHVHQEVINAFILYPAKKLQEAWLETGHSELRQGDYQVKREVASQILQSAGKEMASHLDELNSVHAYILLMGRLIGSAVQSIILQYKSEKIGFAPPMLNDFEQKVQAQAFQEMLAFFEEFDKPLESKKEMHQHLLNLLQNAVQLFHAAVDDLTIASFELVKEMEVYFNSRFYASNYKRSQNK
jgi:hypothetical protein